MAKYAGRVWHVGYEKMPAWVRELCDVENNWGGSVALIPKVIKPGQHALGPGPGDYVVVEENEVVKLYTESEYFRHYAPAQVDP